ncbi:PH domain-containing protein, partial [Haematococcus lacustris]
MRAILSLAAGLESGHLELLARPGDGDLVVTSIEEQYDRAVQCYERYSPHMPSRQRKELQEVVRQLQASLAMQAGNGLASCSQEPLRPDAAADEEGSQKSASAAVLHAKDCLDYCNTHWADLFCRLEGPALLLQASLRPACPPSPLTHTQGHLHFQGR